MLYVQQDKHVLDSVSETSKTESTTNHISYLTDSLNKLCQLNKITLTVMYWAQ